MASRDSACTVRLKPVRANLTKMDVQVGLDPNNIHLPSYPIDFSSAFQDPGSQDYAIDLYFGTPQEANNSVSLLNNSTLFGTRVRASTLGSRLSTHAASFQPRTDVPPGSKVRLTPVRPTLSRDDVIREVQNQLMPRYQPRDVSSAFKDPQSGEFVVDLYFETPEKAVKSLFFLRDKLFFDQIVNAEVVGARGARPTGLNALLSQTQGTPKISQNVHTPQSASSSVPSKTPVKGSNKPVQPSAVAVITVVVEPVLPCPNDTLRADADQALSVLDARFSSKNLHLQRGLLGCEDSSKFHHHISPCAYLHFQDRERAENASKFLSVPGVLFRGVQVRGLLKKDLDAKGSPDAYISPVLTSGYNLRPRDEAAYSQSGVMLYRSKKKFGEVEVLFSRSSAMYSFVEAKRKGGENTKDTAFRVLKEATNINLLEMKNYTQGMDVMWFGKESDSKPEANRALYLVNVSEEKFPHVTEFTCGRKTFVWLPLSTLVGGPQIFPQPLPQVLVNWVAERVAKHAKFNNFYNKVRHELQDAESEEPKVKKLIEENNMPIPKPKSLKLPTDIEYLSKEHREYKEIEKYAREFPVTQIKKVNVPERKERYESYVKSLDNMDKDELRLFHGTPKVEAANNIARVGPDLSLGKRKRFGSGFYTAATPDVPSTDYATNKGALCVCRAAPGKMLCGADLGNLNKKQIEAELGKMDQMQMRARGKDCVVKGDWHVLFHPDAIYVEYIIDYGNDDTVQTRTVEADKAATKKHEMDEYTRLMRKSEQQRRLTMIKYFNKKCQEILKNLQDGMKPEKLPLCEHLFKIECQQFKGKLPMYASKENFLQILEQNQGIVLKGGTGIGKSVLVPQWIYDHLFCPKGYEHWKVAVLVPRRAIAEGLSEHISQVRGCEVGEEIGLGIDGNVKMSSESRIVFMTYGFFRAISVHDTDFSKWGAVILDEAHERKVDADTILARLGAACKARPNNFKVVVMSATIEGSVFVNALKNGGMPKPCPTMEVEGVTFPIQDVWSEGDLVWDPRQEKAIQSLAIEVIKISNKEPVGNILVFLSTIAEVKELTSELGELVKHNKGVIVRSLFASMSDADKKAVTSYDSCKNNNARLICVSTNIAEAGLTIKDISVVVETGWEMEVIYDPITKLTTSQQVHISKASQIQRRGRAGRTMPGTCYCMYSKEEFDKFPDYGRPEMLKTNLENFTLGMLAAGLDPFTTDILDRNKAEARLECAKQHLLGLRAIVQLKDGKFMLTDRGKMLSRLPMELNLGLSIVAASDKDLHCSAPVAIVACMFQQAAWGLFNNDKLPGKEKYKHQSGDHMTYLVVYEAWEKTGKDQRWCNSNGINSALLVAADNLLAKVHTAMVAAKIPLLEPLPSKDRTEMVLRAICIGLCHQTAIPFNTKLFKDGLLLTQDYDKNPTVVHLHRMSALNKSDAPTSQLVVYQSRTQTKDRDLVVGISVVHRSWVEKAMAHDIPGLQTFRQTLNDMERISMSIPTRFQQDAPQQCERNAQRKIQVNAFVNNYKELKLQFKTVYFKFDANLANELFVCSPRDLRDRVVARVEECVGAVQPKSGEIDIVVQATTLPQLLSKLRKDVMEHLGSFCTVEHMGTKCKITTFKVCLDAVLSVACSRLGLQGSIVNGPDLGGNDNERLSAIQCGTRTGIMQKYERGMMGSLLLLAWSVVQEVPSLWIYGGFIRDLIIRGDAHKDIDLDLGAPPGDIKAPMQKVRELAANLGMQFIRLGVNSQFVESSFFKTVDGSMEFEVQVVDAQGWAQKDPRIDFDVNNLKLGPGNQAARGYKLKVDIDGMTLKNVVDNIRNHRLVVHKPAIEVTDRIDKMRRRGWHITYAGLQ